ncbi:MAG: hypothetical protein GY737_13880 [Desulfobacteraceae bacterium]|nr:hypothetical protein [Desulfobacteraceae bacterium]
MQRLIPLQENKQLCSALNRIRTKAQDKTSDEALVIAWLCGSLRRMRQNNDTLQVTPLQWNQGACQLVQEILDSFDTAHDIVRRG